MKKKDSIITIDGPAASGKGTCAVLLANQLNARYIDSGALYRIAALFELDISSLDIEFNVVSSTKGSSQILVAGKDLSRQLKTEEIGKKASIISKKQNIRDMVDAKLLKIMSSGLNVIDGRDMGSNVFPDAKLKFYLDADVQVRATRRYQQLIDLGKSVNINDILDDLVERDIRDRERELSPLIAAEDAVVIDTTNLRVEEVVELMGNYWNNRKYE
jgi:cytidylate kinase